MNIDATEDEEEASMDMINATNEARGKTACPHCGKLYKRVNTHISRSHPEIHRAIIESRHALLQSNPSPNNQQAAECEPRQSASNIRVGKYKQELREYLQRFLEPKENLEHFKDVEEFLSFLATAIYLLPGPTHPARKYYMLRKSGQAGNNQKNKRNCSNPERASKRDKERKKIRYKFELTQFQYYNQRRKAVRGVLADKHAQCRIDSSLVKHHFDEIFSVASPNRLEEYRDRLNAAERQILDETYELIVTKEEVTLAVKAVAVDTAPGPDGVLMRAIKDEVAYEAIASIATRMMVTGSVPPCLQTARTVLIYKAGDDKDHRNWRPITICSVFRRVIEKVLEKRFKKYVSFNQYQNGFTQSPGTLINTSLLSSVLEDAKVNCKDAAVVFLDISKAFDNISHEHMSQTLAAIPAPSKLTDVIRSLQMSNRTQVELPGGRTGYIPIKKGVMQGSPLSPALYNLCTDHILDELCEEKVTTEYGYQLVQGLPPLTVLGFADDTAVIAKNKDSASILARKAVEMFEEIGLHINPEKCTAICIKDGKLYEDTINIGAATVKSIGTDHTVKYLGVDFSSNVVYDHRKMLKVLRTKLDLLTSSPLLLADQKLMVINNFIGPSLIYSFQNGPVSKIPASALDDADRMMRSALKEILQLPTDTPDAMVYAEPRYKGLGLFRIGWEAYLQRLNGLRTLARVNNKQIKESRSLEEEANLILLQLNCEDQKEITRCDELDTQRLRKELRRKAFDKWCQLPHKGKGVVLYSQHPAGNRWVKHRSGLSCSEWRDALKMCCNVAAVRSVPGRSQDGSRCRYCSEIETLAHVLGSCPHGELLRNARHHDVRASLANALREKGFTVHEEVHGIGVNDSVRRIDMIAFKEGSSEGYIIDPTVRFESHLSQPEEVDQEKRLIYLPTVPYYLDKYNLKQIQVVGLMVGARGTVTTFFANLCKQFGLNASVIHTITRLALQGSIRILRHHLTAARKTA